LEAAVGPELSGHGQAKLPVLICEDAVPVELDVIAWRDGLKGK